MSSEEYRTDLRWVVNGPDTWQIFLVKLRGVIASKGALKCLSTPRPEPLLIGTATAREKREELISQWDIWDEKAYGVISTTMLGNLTAQLRMAQIQPDDVGCGHHAAILLREMTDIFDHRDIRTGGNRRDQYKAEKLGRNQTLKEFVTVFENALARVFEVNPTALTVAETIADFSDAISNGEVALQSLVQGISNLQSTQDMAGIQMTLQDAMKLAKDFDSSWSGRERIKLMGRSASAVVAVAAEVKCYNCGNTGHYQNRCPAGRKTPTECNFCHRSGHTERECRQKNPELMQKFLKERSQSNRRSGGAHKAQHRAGGGKPRFDYPRGGGGKPIKPPSFKIGSMLYSVGSLIPELSSRIVIDTGATEDIMILHSADHFDVLQEERGQMGTASQGAVLVTEGVGKAGGFDGVFYAPTVSFSIVSGGRVRGLGLMLLDSSPPTLLNSDREPVLRGTHVLGLPTFDLADFLRLPDIQARTGLSEEGAPNLCNSVVGENSMRLWHYRLGHVPYARLKQIFRNRLVKGIHLERSLLGSRAPEMEVCPSCARGHRRRRVYKARVVDPDPKKELPQEPNRQPIHLCCDWLILINCPSREGYLYVLVLVSQTSRRVWAYPARERTAGEFLRLLRRWHEEEAALQQGGYALQFVHFHSDSAAEFLSKEAHDQFIKWGVKQTASPADTPELNGIVEEVNGQIYARALTMLLHSGLPQVFWWDALDVAANILQNLLPANTTRGWMSPEEFDSGVEPNVSFLRVFGCLCYVNTVRTDKRKDMEERRFIGYLIGYSLKPIGWKIFSPDKARSIVHSTNVVFDEHIPSRPEEYFKHMDKLWVPFSAEEREEASFKWLEGTIHRDDEDLLLYRITRIGTYRWLKTKDRVIVGWRECLAADHPALEMKEPIHVADLERMTLATPQPPPERAESQKPLEEITDPGVAGSIASFPGAVMTCCPSVAVCSADSPRGSRALEVVQSVAGARFQFESAEAQILSEGSERKRPRLGNPGGDSEDIETRSDRVFARAMADGPSRSIGALPRVARTIQGVQHCSLSICANIAAFELGPLVAESSNTMDRPVPRNHQEAMASDYAAEWRAAEESEKNSIRENGVLGPLQPIPRGKKVRTVRYVYKWKPAMPDARGEHSTEPKPPKAKVRLACRDFHWLGTDVGETYAPTGKSLTFRMLMVIALLLSLTVHHVDVKTAFLHAELRPDEEYWMEPFPDEEAQPGWGYRLKKSIYGLRVAPRHWYTLLSSVLLSCGLKRSYLDTCLFWKWTDGRLTLVLIYVDDILIAGPSEEVIAAVKRHLGLKFTLTDLGPLRRYLNVRVTYRLGHSLALDQEEYTEDILRRYAPHWNVLRGQVKKIPLPADAQEFMYSDYEPASNTDEFKWWKAFPFRSIIGALLYLSLNTRIDIAFAVGLLARVASAPTYGACYCAAHLLSYLSGTKSFCLLYSRPLFADLHAFVDADWAGDIKGRRSTSGYLVYCCGGPLAWGSKLMTTIATSSMQAESQSHYYCIATLIFITQTFAELEMPYEPRVRLFTDAEAALKAAHNPEHHQRVKHVETKIWWIRSFVGEGDKAFVDMFHVKTRRMVADLLTKIMTATQLLEHIGHLTGKEVKPSASYL